MILTARIGSVYTDYDDESNEYRINYTVRLWYDGACYNANGTMVLYNNNEIPVMGDGVAVEFNTETKEITIL